VGDKTKEPIEPGLLSRNGWTLVDDSTRLSSIPTILLLSMVSKAPGLGLHSGQLATVRIGTFSAMAIAIRKLSLITFV
jgi:hypothetical protein